MRIYLPATLDELDALRTTGGALTARTAYAVTSALRAALPDEDEEGLEFAAHLSAADGSFALLAGAPDAPRLRLVVTADVPDEAVRALDDAPDERDVTAVALTTPVALDLVACVHVDEPELAPEVDAALAGDEAARERVEEADLLWYDVSELADIPR
ncbi:DUF6912 family protein [Cellulomonas composti]|uniref:Uncharacterized protein n=1 Tax=Cellulomonas composti TaxID=266130 RepID=A0A511JAW8_9CELL|nr:hypothetical protein [Cellulomonas composti]GEL95124.1 hypothetical protein CCO02nite_17820 [Cellulomonas composti]